MTIGRIAHFERLFDPQQPMQQSVQQLLLDGVPIAGLINGAYLDSLYALHIAYDDGLSRLGPGSVRVMMGVRSAIAGRFARFNLLSGFGHHTVRWLAQVTPTRIAQVYRVGSPPDWRRRAGDWRRRLQASPLAGRLLGIAAGWGVSRRNGGDPDAAAAAADAAPPSSADANVTTPALPARLHGLARFNPVRRRVMAPTERSTAPLRDHAHPLSSDQRAHTATLLAQLDSQVRAGSCE
ncbi:MAG: GNAT family N-acetyltransferase, partial [Leptothrix sp. (in: b-proteobacteria)]